MTRRYALERVNLLLAWREWCDRGGDGVALYDAMHELHEAMRQILEQRNATR